MVAYLRANPPPSQRINNSKPSEIGGGVSGGSKLWQQRAANLPHLSAESPSPQLPFRLGSNRILADPQGQKPGRRALEKQRQRRNPRVWHSSDPSPTEIPLFGSRNGTSLST